jgi:hypothetical protein
MIPSIEERLSEQFHKWELRGRGWHVYDRPVTPEPPFRPFFGHFLPDEPRVDDGRRPTVLSSLLDTIRQKLSTDPPPPEPVFEEEDEPEPQFLEREPLVELQTSLPAKLNIDGASFEQFLRHLSYCSEPVVFELLGLSHQTTVQFASHERDTPLIKRQLQAFFPEAVFIPTQGTLEEAWTKEIDVETAIVEFGLSREFMLLLATDTVDPFVGLIGALSELAEGELGLFQVIFEAVEQPWAESITRSVTDAQQRPFFVNRQELVKEAEKKVATPLYAAVIRIAARAGEFGRAWEIVRDLAASLSVFANPTGNELIPLSNDDYPFEAHEEDVVCRQSKRSGVILNASELMGFVHLPSPMVRSTKLRRESAKTKAAPSSVQNDTGVSLGENVHAGKAVEVRLTPEQRTRHMHVIGASGTGKSTLLFYLICQDIRNGEGVAVLDPHGDLVERILGIIPQERISDVILVDPSDELFSVGFNILSAHSDFEKNLLASDLVSVFQRLSTSWGDQMGSVLSNAILAFLESEKGGTLADLRRFLLDPAFRSNFLKTVRDPEIVFYWKQAFPQLSGNKSIGPVLTRLETFLSPKPIRYMVSQQTNRLDFAHMLDSGKIFLAKLPQGQMGKENAFLLGSLLVAKFQQLAMSRQRMSQEKRRDFWLYIDEFQNFITPSMSEILTGARKYRVGLILAHQELRQLQRDSEVAGAVMSNPYTRVVFRVGDADARTLESGFSFFETSDLQNLGTGQAICRIERSDGDFNLAVPLPEEPDPKEAAAIRERVIQTSRETYGTPRSVIEAALLRQAEALTGEEKKVAVTEERERKAPGKPAAQSQAPTESAVATPPIATEQPIAPPSVAPPTAELREKTKSEPQEGEKPKTVPEPGRGGAQHKSIQKRLKEGAERLGYLVTTEKPVSNRTGSIDLALESPNRKIAVEITVTTTIDHEVGNVKKCLEAQFEFVAVVSSSEIKLRQMQEAVVGALGAELSARVGYFLPDPFLAHLEQLAKTDARSATSPVAETTRRGYKVKRSAPKLTPEELKAKENAALRMIADAMKRKKE